MPREVLMVRDVAGCRIEIVRGDLTLEAVDAIVNAANQNLVHGGGLAGAIVERGGPSIQEESLRIAPVPVGGAAVTSAGRLACRWVIHAVGPRWGTGDEESLLRSAVRSAVEQAVEVGARSIALPAISTGIFGYPVGQGTRVLVDEVARLLVGSSPPPLDLIRMVALDEGTSGNFATALSSLHQI